MDIQEPEEAIQYYEKALDQDPDDLVLIRETGRALVMTHDYNRAIKYYEQTLQDDPNLFDLRTDLAELYIKLKAFDDSKRVLIEALKSLKDFKQDLLSKQRNVNTLVLLAKVYLDEDMQGTDWRFKENPDAKQALIEASRSQGDVIELSRQQVSDKLDEEKSLAADISFKLGKYYEERDGNLNEAFVCFNETLTRNNEHKDSMIAIARIHQNQGNNDQCEQFCRKILKLDPSNEDATYMVANLRLMKDETDHAMKSYIELLEKNPNNYNILANLIELLRKAGRI
jgi:tetratricopeptide repeat protein 21B